jgi:hypothetical protein
LKWVQKYWSARGMIWHASAGPLRACVKVANCRDISSVGTITCIKMLVAVLRAFCHRMRTICNSGSFSFVLVRMIRLNCIASSHLVKGV